MCPQACQEAVWTEAQPVVSTGPSQGVVWIDEETREAYSEFQETQAHARETEPEVNRSTENPDRSVIFNLGSSRESDIARNKDDMVGQAIAAQRDDDSKDR